MFVFRRLTEGASHVVGGQPEGGDLVDFLLLFGQVGGPDHATEGVDAAVDAVPTMFFGLIACLLARTVTQKKTEDIRDTNTARNKNGIGWKLAQGYAIDTSSD